MLGCFTSIAWKRGYFSYVNYGHKTWSIIVNAMWNLLFSPLCRSQKLYRNLYALFSPKEPSVI